MVRRHISKYKIMVVNTFPHQSKQKMLGKVIPILKQVGHAHKLNTQIKGLRNSVIDKKICFFVNFDKW